MMQWAALLLLALQENATVVRTEKADYAPAVLRCREAEALVESDPATAIDRFTEVIANPKVAAKIERRVRIEERPAEYTAYYNFTPYLYRGQARLALGKKLEKADPEAAQKQFTAALEDFKESAARKVDKAGELAKAAQADLDRLKAAAFSAPGTPATVDPLVKFRETWDPLILEEKFKSALKLIEADKTLSPEQKKGFVQSTEQKSRELLLKQVASFRPRFSAALSQGLERLTADEFEVAFSLPSPEEAVAAHPVLDWARKHAPAFREVQSGRAGPASLLEAAAASATLEAAGTNPWLAALEAAAFESLRASAAAEVERAKDAPKADREKARAKVQSLSGQYKAFLAKVDPKIQERHRALADHDAQLARMIEGFPVDLAELDRVDADFDAAFAAAAPDAELQKLQLKLEGLEGRGNLSRESRQRLYTAHAVAAALQGLFAGRSEDAVASGLGALREKLREVGGAADVKQYGPRVAKVLAALK